MQEQIEDHLNTLDALKDLGLNTLESADGDLSQVYPLIVTLLYVFGDYLADIRAALYCPPLR